MLGFCIGSDGLKFFVGLFLADQCGPRLSPPSTGEQPLPHRGERVRSEEVSEVQRAHHSLRKEGLAPER